MVQNNKLSVSVHKIKDNFYHWHNGLTLLKVISGKIMIRARARKTILSAGDFIVINDGEIHQFTAITDENYIIQINFSNAFCQIAHNAYEHAVIHCNSAIYTCDHPLKYQYFSYKLNMFLHNIRRSKAIEFEEIDLKLGEELIRFLCEEFDYISGGYKLKPFSTSVIERNRWLFNQVFDSAGAFHTCNLKEVSQLLGVSYSYYRRDIINRYGFGFKYIQSVFMAEAAAKMLIHSSYSATTISCQCGFSDYKYMLKYFKLLFDCTPLAFRKAYKKPLDLPISIH